MKTKLAIAVIALLFPLAGLAQAPAPLIQNALGRHTISLNGDWHFLIDAHDNGVQRGFFRNGQSSGQRNFVEYDFNTAPTLHVPGDWNSQRPELQFYEGSVWYQKTFQYHPTPGNLAFLYFGAANYRTKIWINSQPLCEHEGGFTTFNCDATSLLKDGENVVIIYVNDVRHSDDVPGLTPDWFTYGGITRDVMLVEVPKQYIEQYSLQLDRGSTRHISGWVRVAGASGAEKITVRIPELKASATATTDGEGVAHISFDAPGLQLWSPENPKLYPVEIASAGDTVQDELGFRTIEVRGTEILLNGRSIFLRGVSMHEEAPDRFGRAHGDDDARTLLSWARELGCNYVRMAHYPYDEHMTRMADRMGVLVWSEVPVYQAIDWSNPQVLAKAKQQLTEMITRDRNRAAIIFWSVTNESPRKPERNVFIHDMVATARSLDPTRLIVAATNQISSPDPHTRVLDDPMIADLDAFGMNEYIGWYQGAPADMDTTTWTNPFNKPVLVSEFGAEAKQGLHGSADQRWTEEYQEDVYKHQLAALRKLPFLRGMTPWILKDFRSPHRLLPGIQDGYNRKGLISDTGQKKKAFYVLQQFYREKAAER